MTQARRLQISLVLLALATGLGLRWATTQNGVTPDSLLTAWSSSRLSPASVLLVLSLSAAVYFADAFRYWVYARAFGVPLSYAAGLRASIGCLLFSWISPGAALGAPAATCLLIRDGIRWDDALLVSFGKSLSSSLLLLLASGALIALGYLPGGARSTSSVFLLLCLASYVALLATPPLRKRLRLLFSAGPGALLLIFISHAIYFAALIGILAALALALGAAPAGRTFAVSSLFLTLMYMSPTPSGSGIAEATAVTFFGQLVGPARALLAVLLFRAATYYAQIAFGTAFFATTGGWKALRELLEFRARKETEPPGAAVDYAGLWFRILEEQGEFVRIPFGKLGAGQSEPEWKFLSHAEHDGVGGLSELLRREGYRIEALPAIQDARRPGPVGAALSFARAQISSNRFRHMPWKSYDPSRPGGFTGIAWHLFSEAESARISAGAKGLGISTNSLLFWSLDRQIQSLFSDPEFPRQWMIPVNMRGAVRGGRETANLSSFIGVSVPARATAGDVHERIHREIRRHSHWGNWWSIQSGRWLGPAAMRKALAAYKSRGANWTGLFSNLGKWPPPGAEAPDHASPAPSWILGVIVTQGHPVGGGCMTWNDRLGISLTFHPSLGLARADFDKHLRGWIAGILGSCAEA